MDIETTKCDYCGTLKMESNNWWTAVVTNKYGLMIGLYYKGKKKPAEAKDCCGESCLQKAIKDFIKTTTLNTAAAPDR